MTRFATLLYALLLLTTALAGSSIAEEDAQQQQPAVFCLTTEWFPLPKSESSALESRMLRELARQAVLIAARDELGLSTRDQTLGETFAAPADTPVEQFSLRFRTFQDGHFELQLQHDSAADSEGEKQQPLWEHKDRLKQKGQRRYVALANRFSKLIPDIAQAIDSVGVQNSSVAPTTKASDNTAARLQEMNFVSQFAAVRAAHRALAADQSDFDALAHLVRGYAHLSALTTHYWSTHSEAFAARSILYALRLRDATDNSLQAKWHRAYAFSATGMHRLGSKVLNGIAKQISQDPNDAETTESETTNESDSETPIWAPLLRAYCDCSVAGVEKFRKDSGPEWNELASFIRWQLYRSYNHGRWIYEKGNEAAEQCPEVYGIYSTMANWDALGIKRRGAWASMRTFTSRLPARVSQLEDLPSEVRAISSPGGGLLSMILGNRNQQEEAHLIPIDLSEALVKHTAQAKQALEPSWSMLGNLIAEEQFVVAADYIRVSQSGVEHSSTELLDHVMPMVGDHLYRRYLLTYDLPKRYSPEDLADIVSDMPIRDPRGNMYRMLVRLWQYRFPPHSYTGGSLSYDLLFEAHPLTCRDDRSDRRCGRSLEQAHVQRRRTTD